MNKQPKTKTIGADIMHFIYVFDTTAKQKLLSAGYKLLKEDDQSCVFIFENDSSLKFDLEQSTFAYSNVLTF